METTKNIKSQDVKKILLMKIEVKKGVDAIRYSDNASVIISGQKYYSLVDEDMSDFAIEFYKLLYGIDRILNEDGSLHNLDFAGDTMCSFNTIANRVPEAGKCRATRTDFNDWPQYLQQYYSLYHCLANFWILPMEVGRTNYKMSKMMTSKDYMDRFLKYYGNNFETYKSKYPCYSSKFKFFDDFLKEHYLLGNDNYVILNENGGLSINNFSDSKKEPQIIISRMMKLIESRAETISKSKHCELLWDYFHTLNLC